MRLPAQAAALGFERDEDGTGLDEILIRDAGGPDALPLLQYALDQLYHAARGRLLNAGQRLGEVATDQDVLTLSIKDYQDLGGLAGAIGKQAEQAVSGLPPAALAALPRLVRALTEGGEGAVVLRAASMQEVASEKAAVPLAEALVEARILVQDGGQLRFAHEKALTAWPRAAQAVAEAADFLRVRSELVRAEERWQQQGRRNDLLLPPGVRLAEAEAALNGYGAELPAALHDFVRDSGRKARRSQRLTTLAAVLFAALAVASGYFFLDARESARQALAAQAVAESAQARAERNFDTAQTAIDALIFDIVHGLEDVEGMRLSARRRILGQAEAAIDTLLSADPDNPKLLRSQAAMFIKFSDAYMMPVTARPPGRWRARARRSCVPWLRRTQTTSSGNGT